MLYADIDFDGASVTDSKDKIKFTNKDATIGPATVTSGGKDYSVPALHAYTDKYVIGEFKELASASDFKTWAGSGFCMEAFFVDKTASKSVHGIMCGTQSGGWGLAVTGAPADIHNVPGCGIVPFCPIGDLPAVHVGVLVVGHQSFHGAV